MLVLIYLSIAKAALKMDEIWIDIINEWLTFKEFSNLLETSSKIAFLDDSVLISDKFYYEHNFDDHTRQSNSNIGVWKFDHGFKSVNYFQHDTDLRAQFHVNFKYMVQAVRHACLSWTTAGTFQPSEDALSAFLQRFPCLRSIEICNSSAVCDNLLSVSNILFLKSTIRSLKLLRCDHVFVTWNFLMKLAERCHDLVCFVISYKAFGVTNQQAERFEGNALLELLRVNENLCKVEIDYHGAPGLFRQILCAMYTTPHRAKKMKEITLRLIGPITQVGFFEYIVNIIQKCTNLTHLRVCVVNAAGGHFMFDLEYTSDSVTLSKTIAIRMHNTCDFASPASSDHEQFIKLFKECTFFTSIVFIDVKRDVFSAEVVSAIARNHWLKTFRYTPKTIPLRGEPFTKGLVELFAPIYKRCRDLWFDDGQMEVDGYCFDPKVDKKF